MQEVAWQSHINEWHFTLPVIHHTVAEVAAVLFGILLI